MNVQRAAVLCCGVLLVAGLLAGCSAQPEPANASNNTSAGQSGSSSTAATNGRTNASASNANGTALDTNSTSTSSPGNSVSVSNQTASQPATGTSLVRQSMTLATTGRAPNIPFSLQQNISVVQQAWGHPDSQNPAGAGIYASFGAHQTALGFNKGGQIFDLRSYSPNIEHITIADVKAVLGQPGEIRESSDSIIYMYPAGPDYQLLWVFPKTSSGKAANAVNHVSVFWPQGTVDSMAATQPAPSVVLDNAPGTVGNLFTFSVENPPKGYRLVELEWLSESQKSVVNTVNEALQNGRTGTADPGFNISGDLQTYSFVYPASMKGNKGRVRLIFQAVSGAAMMGYSKSVTLR